MAWGQVQKEPVICEETVDPCDDTLIGNLRVRGVWQPQVDAVFDVHVADTDAPSYRSQSPEAVLYSAKVENRSTQQLAWLIVLVSLLSAFR